MPRNKNSKSTRESTRQRRMFLEALESRNLLAGNVTAFVAGGTLFIRGDNAGNGVIVSEVGDNEYSVTGFDQDGTGTRIKTSKNDNGPSNNTQVFSGVTVNIDIDLKKGDDAIAVGNDIGELNDLTLDCFDEEIVPDGGENNDLITPSAVFPGTLEVPLDLIINTGDGFDEVAVIAEARDGVILTGNHDDLVAVGSSVFHDDLIIDTGKGGDGVCIGNTEVADLLSVATGQGTDGLDLFNSSLGSLVVAMGEGLDFGSVAGVEVEFGAAINMGNGGSELGVFEFSAQSLVITAANGEDSVNVNLVEIGVLSIVTGNQADEVNVSSAELKTVSVVTGNGEDDVRMSEFIAQTVVVSTGNDHDEVHLSEFDAQSVVVDTGNGNDGSEDEEMSPITVENASIDLSLVVNTGAGEDLVSVNNVEVGTDLVVDTGKHNDSVEITEVLVHGNAVLLLGAGNDSLFAEDLEVLGNATLDAGAGHDEVIISLSNVDGLFLAFMGAGNDMLSIFESTAGEARLYGGENSNDFDTFTSDSDDADVFEFEDINLI